jgi:hypothetical protein
MEALLKLFTLVNELSAAVPAAFAAVTGSFSEDDGAKLKAAVLELRAKNDANFDAVMASLKSKV